MNKIITYYLPITFLHGARSCPIKNLQAWFLDTSFCYHTRGSQWHSAEKVCAELPKRV